jgi:hypothetical protein
MLRVRGIAAEDYLVLRRWMDVTRDLSQANNRNINMLSSRHMLRHDIAAEISRVSDFRSLPAIEPHFTSIDLQLTSIFTHTHTPNISIRACSCILRWSPTTRLRQRKRRSSSNKQWISDWPCKQCWRTPSPYSTSGQINMHFHADSLIIFPYLNT